MKDEGRPAWGGASAERARNTLASLPIEAHGLIRRAAYLLSVGSDALYRLHKDADGEWGESEAALKANAQAREMDEVNSRLRAIAMKKS